MPALWVHIGIDLGIILTAIGLILIASSIFRRREEKLTLPLAAGKGGSGTVIGNNAKIYGGKGGIGIGGGDGGSGFVQGDNALIIGGNAGNGGYIDKDGIAHGGAGGTSPLERLKELGISSLGLEIHETIRNLRDEYILSHDNLSTTIIFGTAISQEDWINNRLKEMNIPFKYKETIGGYAMTPIAQL